MNKLDDDLREECHRLAMAVAPELQEQPLYVLGADELAGLPISASCYGWADTWGRNVHYRDRLGDRWQGVGPVVCLDASEIERDCKNFRMATLQVMVHEVAHLVPPHPQSPLPAEVTEGVRALQLLVMKSNAQATEPPPDAAGFQHGPEFVRAAIHCYVRANLAGWVLETQHLFGGTAISWPDASWDLRWKNPMTMIVTHP
jgi:hypothetical protein